jgi:hypothetical protein
MLPPDAEYSIYHDGNFQLRQDPQFVIQQLLDDRRQWAAHKHPCRDCLYEEAEVILRDCPLVDKDAVIKQVAGYRELGWPDNAGLWANGFIVRRHTPEVARLNELWWECYQAGSERDQLSFPIAHSNSGMEITTIDANIFSSPWILFRWHAAWKDKEDNPDYWPERTDTRERLGRLAELVGNNGIKYAAY